MLQRMQPGLCRTAPRWKASKKLDRMTVIYVVDDSRVVHTNEHIYRQLNVTLHELRDYPPDKAARANDNKIISHK